MIESLIALLAVILFIAALLARGAARRARGRAGLPAGEIVYSDTGREKRPRRILISRRYGLKGRPDYLVETSGGVVPVEIKSSARPASGRPYDSHVMQLASYCLLCEDALAVNVPFGIIRYRDGETRVEYTPELRARLLALLEEMRAARTVPVVHRSHTQARRCAGCAFRDVCGEALSD